VKLCERKMPFEGLSKQLRESKFGASEICRDHN
jgi:hypothetical protein